MPAHEAPAHETRKPDAKPRLLSGMQPTHDSLHLGNYLGALVNWVEMQETHDAFYVVVGSCPVLPDLVRPVE